MIICDKCEKKKATRRINTSLIEMELLPYEGDEEMNFCKGCFKEIIKSAEKGS